MFKAALLWLSIFAVVTVKGDLSYDEQIIDEIEHLRNIALDNSQIKGTSSPPFTSFLHNLRSKTCAALIRDVIKKPRYCRGRDEVARFLCNYQANLHDLRKISSNLLFIKDTNITTYNSNRSNKFSSLFTKWNLAMEKKGKLLKTNFLLTRTQNRMLTILTRSAEPKQPALRNIRSELATKVRNIYSKAKICRPENPGKCYRYEPGIINLMSKSRNQSELLWAWKSWRDAIGPKIRDDWLEIVNIDNIGAWENGYHDYGVYWRSRYEDSNFENEVDDLWEELKPLYQQLHAYVRYKLHKYYGNSVGLEDPIPAHLLGNIWSMKWDHIFDIVKPFPTVHSFDVTGGLKRQNITVNKMYHMADKFYRSIGLPPMPTSFWQRSMFVRPANRSVVCYASAFNMEDSDVRVKVCTEVNAEYFYTVHHEMGHCQYYLAYNKAQPELFQQGANNGFHEAIGDTAALSVISLTHLKKLGILKDDSATTAELKHKSHINMLMQKALGKLAFYPYALTMAKFRWKLFRGDITEDEVNEGWWHLRTKFQGIRPPVARTEHDFDPGCKYHITYMVPYVRYFLSHILQFQFYERLCKLSGHKGPLYLCDFQGSTVAGKAFEDMLKRGESQNWKLTLEEFLGSPNAKMSVRSAINYFKPLLDWLKTENNKLGNKIGWE